MNGAVLYHYWRSSSSWRVRWAMKIKKFEATLVAVNLVDGESESPAHLERNPLGYVPVLQLSEQALPKKTLIESVAIIEWLEENFPQPALYPGDSFQRAHIRSLVEIINADTQPVQNPGVTEKYSSDEHKKKEWNQYFIRRGLGAYETLARSSAGKFSVGNQVTAADLFLIPQCYNAKRFELSLDEFPLVNQIFEACMQTPEAQASSPEKFKPA